MSASPTPMSMWTPAIAGKAHAPGDRAAGIASSPAQTVAENDRRRPRRDGDGDEPAAVAGQDFAPQAGVQQVPAHAVDDAHVEDVGPQRRDAAVGEDEALHEQDRRQHDHGRAGTEQHGRQHAADQVAAGPAGDGEVEHLGREDEGRRQAQQRHAPGRQVRVRPPQRHAQARRGEHARRRRRLEVEEAVGDVHGRAFESASLAG